VLEALITVVRDRHFGVLRPRTCGVQIEAIAGFPTQLLLRLDKPEKACGNARLENVLFTRELDRRHRADGIAAVAVNPGVVRSSFASDTDRDDSGQPRLLLAVCGRPNQEPVIRLPGRRHSKRNAVELVGQFRRQPTRNTTTSSLGL
jgi:NAD(P)-dependent dehydrogenase (short-subunit alcohol dehydrogenase family)